MAQTESTMPALGRPAPDFELLDVCPARSVRIGSFAGKQALLVMFISRHRPDAQTVKHELARLGKDYALSCSGSWPFFHRIMLRSIRTMRLNSSSRPRRSSA